jgi:Flp pilus assembly protein TadB
MTDFNVFSKNDLFVVAFAALMFLLFFLILILVRRSQSARIERENQKLLDDIKQADAEKKKTGRKPRVQTMTASFAPEAEEAPSQAKPQGTAKVEYDETIEALITNHHEQALREASTQFWFSLVAACVGFVFIAITFFISKDAEWISKLVTAIPGVIIEAVSALFFSQSKETRERSSDFLNRLREDRKFDKGIEIANTIQDDALKSKMLATIALSLCSISTSVLQDQAKPANLPAEEKK